MTGLLTALTPMTRTQGTYMGEEEKMKMIIRLNIMNMLVWLLESNLPTTTTITIYNNHNWLEDIWTLHGWYFCTKRLKLQDRLPLGWVLWLPLYIYWVWLCLLIHSWIGTFETLWSKLFPMTDTWFSMLVWKFYHHFYRNPVQSISVYPCHFKVLLSNACRWS